MSSQVTTPEIAFLSKRDSLKLLLRKQRKEKSTVRVLFYSPFTVGSQALMDTVKANYNGPKLNVISAWDRPESYSTFNITSPHALVSISPNGLSVETYLPRIYEELGV